MLVGEGCCQCSWIRDGYSRGRTSGHGGHETIRGTHGEHETIVTSSREVPTQGSATPDSLSWPACRCGMGGSDPRLTVVASMSLWYAGSQQSPLGLQYPSCYLMVQG